MREVPAASQSNLLPEWLVRLIVTKEEVHRIDQVLGGLSAVLTDVLSLEARTNTALKNANPIAMKLFGSSLLCF